MRRALFTHAATGGAYGRAEMSQYQFTPSSNDLLAMIVNAEARFDSDREQLELRRDAQDCARIEKIMIELDVCLCVLTLSSGWWRGPFCVLRTSESCGTYTVFTVKVKLIIPLFLY